MPFLKSVPPDSLKSKYAWGKKCPIPNKNKSFIIKIFVLVIKTKRFSHVKIIFKIFLRTFEILVKKLGFSGVNARPYIVTNDY